MQVRDVVPETSRGFSRILLSPRNFHFQNLPRVCMMHSSNISRCGVWAICLVFQPEVAMVKALVRKQAALQESSRAHPRSWCHSGEKSPQLCSAAQLSGPRSPAFPVLPVCVFMGSRTTLPEQSASLKATAQSAFQNSPSAQPVIIL